jgi:hypothetical protein
LWLNVLLASPAYAYCFELSTSISRFVLKASNE